MEIMNTLTTKAVILVLFANVYEMTNEKGQPMSGCTVHYLFWGEYGENLFSSAEFNPLKPVGVQRAKCSIDKDLREKLVVAPALYVGDFVMSVGGDGKPVSKLVDVAYLARVNMTPKILPGFVCDGMIPEEEAAKILHLVKDEDKPAETAANDKPDDGNKKGTK